MNKPSSPAHYLIPGQDIQLVDIIKSKLTVGEWQAFLWASMEQYCYRLAWKGQAKDDIDKLIVYAGWLKESVEAHGVKMGTPAVVPGLNLRG